MADFKIRCLLIASDETNAIRQAGAIQDFLVLNWDTNPIVSSASTLRVDIVPVRTGGYRPMVLSAAMEKINKPDVFAAVFCNPDSGIMVSSLCREFAATRPDTQVLYFDKEDHLARSIKSENKVSNFAYIPAGPIEQVCQQVFDTILNGIVNETRARVIGAHANGKRSVSEDSAPTDWSPQDFTASSTID